MLKRLRIAILLYVLLFVAAGQFFAAKSATDWDAPLWVDIYTVAGDDRPATRSFIEGLSPTEFSAAEEFSRAKRSATGSLSSNRSSSGSLASTAATCRSSTRAPGPSVCSAGACACVGSL